MSVLLDRRPIYFMSGFGGGSYYENNPWGLDPNYLRDPETWIGSQLAQMNRLGGPSKIRPYFSIPMGSLKNQVFPGALYPTFIPIVRRLFFEVLPRIAGGYAWGIHWGWPIPSHKDSTRMDMASTLAAPTAQERREWLRINCVPFRRGSPVRAFSADQGSAATLEDMEVGREYLARFGMKLIGEAWPMRQPDPTTPAEVVREGFQRIGWQMAYAHLHDFHPKVLSTISFNENEEAHLLTLFDPTMVKPTAAQAAALRSRGIIMGIGGGFTDQYASDITGLSLVS